MIHLSHYRQFIQDDFWECVDEGLLQLIDHDPREFSSTGPSLEHFRKRTRPQPTADPAPEHSRPRLKPVSRG
jgi:hypothetical protein